MQRELAIPAEPAGLGQARAFVEEVAAAAGFDQEVRYQITMAANEAVSNAVEHGAPCEGNRIHLIAAVEDGGFALHVRDCGEFGSGERKPDPIAERGRGFAFMNLLMDDVRLESEPGCTRVRLLKRRVPSSADEHPAEEYENAALVRRLLAAFARRDADAIRPLVDLGVMFEPLSTEIRQRVPYLGHAGLRHYLDDLEETWDEFELTLGELRSRGSHVVALCHIRARAGDFHVEGPAGIVWRLRDGRAVWGKVYGSEAEALEAAGLPPASG